MNKPSNVSLQSPLPSLVNVDIIKYVEPESVILVLCASDESLWCKIVFLILFLMYLMIFDLFRADSGDKTMETMSQGKSLTRMCTLVNVCICWSYEYLFHAILFYVDKKNMDCMDKNGELFQMMVNM